MVDGKCGFGVEESRTRHRRLVVQVFRGLRV
jgi:hypothetical protein